MQRDKSRETTSERERERGRSDTFKSYLSVNLLIIKFNYNKKGVFPQNGERYIYKVSKRES